MIRVGLCLSYNSYPILSCPVLSPGVCGDILRELATIGFGR